MRLFENRLLRRIFGPKREEVTGERRTLHNKFYDPYSSLNNIQVIKSRRMRWAGHVAHMGARRGDYKVLVGRLEGKRVLGTPRCGCEDNITMDQKVGWEHGLV